jgi:predicted metal-dependent hydrolase
MARKGFELEEGLALIERGEYFAAHEVLEDAWRAAPPEERDFFQGLVHVAVAWYQAGRSKQVGCERQLEKAARRLRPYAPAHRGLDVAALIAQVESLSYPLGEHPLLRRTRSDPVE